MSDSAASSQTTPYAAENLRPHAVTGAFGFTGSRVAAALLESGRRVITLTSSGERPSPLQGRVEVHPFLFDDVSAMAKSLEGVEVLYNTYWVRCNHASFSHATAVRNTLALFEAAKKAGVSRIVHVSITNADSHSPYEYFSAKGHIEEALKAVYGKEGSGLSYAIVRPAVLFGPGDILVNNMAWALRRFPLFCMFGEGGYHVQPVHVDDLAALLVRVGAQSESLTVNAVGPEDFTYRELVDTLSEAVGKKRRIISVPNVVGAKLCRLIGLLVGDVFITEEEIEALTADLLHAPDSAAPEGAVRLSEWAHEQGKSLGRRYHAELDRRFRKDMAY